MGDFVEGVKLNDEKIEQGKFKWEVLHGKGTREENNILLKGKFSNGSLNGKGWKIIYD